MSIGAVFIGLALLIIAVPVVAGPVINKRRERFSLVDEPEEPEMQNQYQQTLRALQELDFDHHLEVVGDEDYAAQRDVLMAQAAQAKETITTSHDNDVEARIEAAILSRRSRQNNEKAAGQSCYHCGVEMGADDKFCSECGTPATSGCPHCGQEAHPNDNFCVSCGQAITMAVMG